MKPTRPRIRWAKVWAEFDRRRDAECSDRAGEKLLLSRIVELHLAPWGIVFWQSIWGQFDILWKRRDNGRVLFQKLVRKHLQEPKK